MDYPETFLRGIPNNSFIDEDGHPATHLFYIETESKRKDDYKEESIFWKDDDRAVDLILLQKKADDSIQFQAGAAVLNRDQIDRIKNQVQAKNKFNYERKKQPGNPYHGNLLLKKDVKKPLMIRIAASIALTC